MIPPPMKIETPNAPLVSIALPLAAGSSPELVAICLRSIESQTYPNCETLVFLSTDSSTEIVRQLRSVEFIRLFEGRLSKSAARNLLAREAVGQYMLYIDVDQELTPNLIEDCVKKASSNGASAVYIPPQEATSNSLVSRARSLERELLATDESWDIPTFIDLDTFFNVGGFDESIDVFDDVVLMLNLEQSGIRVSRSEKRLLIRETTKISQILRRKYDRGRASRALIAKFPNARQARRGDRFRDAYLLNWRRLANSPIASLALFTLKILEYGSFMFGALNQSKAKQTDGVLHYQTREVANSYDESRLGDNFNRYKHYAELRSLALIIPRDSQSTLEVGCGTGRITEELVERFSSVHAVDPSRAMLDRYLTKPLLPAPVRASGLDLPFPSGEFEGAISLRVIWHLKGGKQFKRMSNEMFRVASHFVVIDLANAERWQHPILSKAAEIYFRLSPSNRDAHRTSQFHSVGHLERLAASSDYEISQIVPLDVGSPIWLNLLPQFLANALHPLVYRIELEMAKLVPPGRLLVRLTKFSSPDQPDLPLS